MVIHQRTANNDTMMPSSILWKRWFGTLVCFFMLATLSSAFVAPLLSSPSSNNIFCTNTRRFSSSSSSSSDPQLEQKELRNVIASRNEQVENEEQFAVADGANLYDNVDKEAVEQVLASASTSSTATATAATPSSSTTSPLSQDRTSLAWKMERITKPRAYPLFLAEKAAEFVESSVEDLFGKSSSSVKRSGVKERIVILGTGWGGASFLKAIDTDMYDVTIISPRNHFVFTPMLAGASVGTVEFRSICEPIREINPQATYLEATATNIDATKQVVSCQSVVCDGNSCDIEEFDVEYDRLIVTIGAQTNTFGIPGVRENCNFLKTIEDARRIRTALVNCFERANLPGMTEEQRIRDLTFAVIGAGPTGIEFAAELRDFIEQDGPKYYPNLLKYVRIKVIEASSTILAPFEKSLQQEAVRQLERTVDISNPEVRDLIPERFKLTELLLDSSVKEVTSNTILLNDGTIIPYGVAVWAAGNGPIALTLQLIEALGSEQAAEQSIARGRLAIDPWMRAVGGNGKILAFGDCSCISQKQLPATAQVASQQGEYLAHIFNKNFELSPARDAASGLLPPPIKDPALTTLSLSDSIANFATNNDEYAKPFQFLNLGILAYTGGGSALAQVTPAPDAKALTGSGALGNAVWKGVYLSKQVSWRNRLLVINDWTKRQLFGRDITRI